MNSLFQFHFVIREKLASALHDNSFDELTVIPDGFNNNIYWNIAHCLATQQLLIYYLSGNQLRVDQYWIDKYKKGTFPNMDVTESEVDDLYYLLTETSKVMRKDYDEKLFTEYKPYSTAFGTDLKSIEDAVNFNNIHEGMHWGIVKAQKRALIGERD